ncbi:unnamed protein product [Pylaiella littoralis]
MLASAARGCLGHLGLLSPEWPNWAVETFVSLSFCCTALVAGQWLYDRPGRSIPSGADTAGAEKEGETNGGRGVVSGSAAPAFRRFQAKYLAVYLTVMLADWLQGTNMYTLYLSYDVDVGTLFLTGFSSAAVFGTFLGMFVDRFGRRNGCIVFCLLEVLINILEHIPDMRVLLLGRVLGGISTSLLFSAFESWMVSEHRKQDFPEEWLASTFSVATVGNGIMAVFAGVIAQVASDKLGDIGPFQAAIALTLLAMALLMMWDENYGYGEEARNSSANGTGSGATNGNRKITRKEAPASTTADALVTNGGGETCDIAGAAATATVGKSSVVPSYSNGTGAMGNGDDGDNNSRLCCNGDGDVGGGDVGEWVPSLRKSVSMAWGCIVSDNRVLLLGMVQSLFEGGTFTFVFMWVPTLKEVVPGGVLPTGLIFSSFMVCITIGGVLFSIMLRKMTVELASALVFFVAAASMALPAVSRDFHTVLGAFLVLETCVGAFYSCSGLMRSRYLPGGLQSSVMNIFRLPLNVLVVVGTRVTDIAEPETVFMVIASWFLTSAVLQLRLSAYANVAAAATLEVDEKRRKAKSD